MRRCLILLALAGCQDYHVAGKDEDLDLPLDDTDVADGVGLCGFSVEPDVADPLDGCSDYAIGSFNPWVEWEGPTGWNSLALPVVGDVDGDGRPEIVTNLINTPVGFPKGQLWVFHGDDSGLLWKVTNANLGMGASPALGDLDGDGDVEIVAVRSTGSQFPLAPLAQSTYKVVAWDHDGKEIWSSAQFLRTDFDYAAAPVLADMDHDGHTEVVVGRVILNYDGTTRGKGTHGRGSWGSVGSIGESAIPAVADLDLDGTEEVIVGNAMYDPDGNELWYDKRRDDGMVAVANLDGDDEGEFVVVSAGTVRAHDTNGALMWGPEQLWCDADGCEQLVDSDSPGPVGRIPANILSVPAIDDLDGDGMPEIVVAGGSQVVAFHHDGTTFWTNEEVTDVTGATGASIFDFDADGIKEVVYIDEISVYAFDGRDGTTVFLSEDHASNTLFDYPVIADVDADGSAEIVVSHNFYNRPFTVYGAGDGYWAPTRRVWNQHAYSINNIDDDLHVPADPPPAFTTHNSWHAARSTDLENLGKPDVQVRVADVCQAECDNGFLYVATQVVNRSSDVDVGAGVSLTLYAKNSGRFTVVETKTTQEVAAAASRGEAVVFAVPAAVARDADELQVVIDDDGSGRGIVAECVEDDNAVDLHGPFCRIRN